MLPILLTFIVSCTSTESPQQKKTFDQLRLAPGLSSGDNDQGGEIMITTCGIAGPMETTAILQVKSLPVMTYANRDCDVVDEFEKPYVSAKAELVSHIAGESLPQIFSLAELAVDYPRLGGALPGDYLLVSLRKAGDTHWFSTSINWIYDDENPLRPGFDGGSSYTYTYALPTTFDELVADAADVRANFEERCAATPGIDMNSRLADDEVFYLSMTKSRYPKSWCNEVKEQEEELTP